MDLITKTTAELHAMIAEAHSGAPDEKEHTATIEACERELGMRGGWVNPDV